ncbi:tail tube monomer [Acinetobacter phage SH-Ab 15599]|nr:tail tube monomer [Acinetobacter phage SH-Ab 15599]
MSEQLQQFINLVKTKDVQRTNRFSVQLAVPEAVLNKFNAEYNNDPILNRINLTARDTNLPGFSIAASEIHVGFTAYVAYEKSNGDFAITFICMGDMLEHKFFTIWREVIFKEDHTVGFYDDYVSEQVAIILKDRMDRDVRKCVATEVWPSIVTDLTINREERDVVGSFTVTFKYRKLKSMDKSNSNAGVVKK